LWRGVQLDGFTAEGAFPYSHLITDCSSSTPCLMSFADDCGVGAVAHAVITAPFDLVLRATEPANDGRTRNVCKQLHELSQLSNVLGAPQ